MAILHLVYPFKLDGHLSCLCLLAVINHAAIDVCIPVSVSTYAFISLGEVLRNEMLGHTVNLR